MGRLTLITGGAKSGKSAFAESQCPADQSVCYVATGVVKHPDAEMQLRIKRHQQRRPAQWVTAERYRQVDDLLATDPYRDYLVDDATMLTTNLFYDLVADLATAQQDPDFDHVLAQASREDLAHIRKQILDEWQRIIQVVATHDIHVIVVTNEVGLGIVPATLQTRLLRDLYGEVNQRLARAATAVTFVVSGLPQRLK
ncbi:bifunctional adenosylcobinamide kinase/adenosylcobinamide-phosphate guanylyltransferase [Levilactobacillus cerevisiae]|uniref:bifunctional adenosylcobinamide kinase/adenosylcobinamide-phosphate guanylyltransferase n=1 Tax=Levilactobacillus cerevisiae TaxID=1704076 RepID=UPI000F77B5A0|nr:bifunctional adenosylcobinamide kinase/adenosylcobinamide-phosphate guanylyltransferase [Levilactobacillus cerevisiae]